MTSRQPGIAVVLTRLFWLLGIGLLAWLLWRHGLTDLRDGLATAGWGLLAVTAFYSLPLLCNTLGWQAMIPSHCRPNLARTLWARWIGGAINDLLPVAKIGGDLVRARLISRHGVPGVWAGASVVAEITAGIATQLGFALLGVALLLQRPGAGETSRMALAGLAAFSVMIAGFYAAQRTGLFRRLARALETVFQNQGAAAMVDSAGELDAAILACYRHRRAFAGAAAWRFAGWLTGAGEVWLALWLLGQPVSPVEAIILESLIQFVRNAAFMVPGALGVQEGALILLGAALGLGPNTALELSLVKRVRELLLGLPALAIWLLAGLRQTRPERASG